MTTAETPPRDYRGGLSAMGARGPLLPCGAPQPTSKQDTEMKTKKKLPEKAPWLLSENEALGLSVRDINTLFRRSDESGKWPVCGAFNVTERAIRRIRRHRRDGLVPGGGPEYIAALRREISIIVNHI